MASTAALQILMTAEDKATPVLKKFGESAKLALKTLGGAAAGSAIGFLADAARGAAEDEANMAKLQQAVENSGASWETYGDTIDATIKKGQALAFSDDATRNSLASLTESTGSVDEAMKRLPVAMDLARAKGISLEAASKLLGKVSDENTKALSKYGIVMDKGATATDVLAKVQQIAGGQAETYGKSTAGMLDKTKDAFGEWKESVGAALGPAQGVIAMLPGLSAGMSGAGAAVGALSSLIKLTFIPTLIAMAVPFLPIILVVGAIGVAVGLLALAWSNNFGDIQGKTKAAVKFLLDLFDGFKLLLLNVWKGIVLGVAGAINGVIGVINGFIEAYNGVAEKLGLPIIGKIELVTPNLDAVDKEINRVARDREARVFADVYERAASGGGGVLRGKAYAEGTDFVPQTGLALLHRGEAVIPASQNRGGWSGGGVTVTVNVHGSVIGLTDLEARVRQAVVDGVRGGGFRGVFR